MNEATLTQLKVLVERAVRPLQASSQRKQEMREELLAHLTAVFEEEAKTGDEAAALARTTQRFGDPVELAYTLEQAVPATDALTRWSENLIFAPGKSTFTRACRGAVAVLLATGAFLLLALFDCGRPSEWSPTMLQFCGAILAGMATMAIAFHVLLDLIRRVLFESNRRSKLKLAAICIGGDLLYAGAILLPSLVLEESIRWSLLPAAIVFGAAMLALMFYLAPSANRRLQQFREWAVLPVDQGMRIHG
ncbi:MAG TPA: hypothetical protein VFE62_05790 [Gemmataceae bacterium]|nr:hypothetical protein [Gemmataceae bacterium]